MNLLEELIKVLDENMLYETDFYLEILNKKTLSKEDADRGINALDNLNAQEEPIYDKLIEYINK